MNGINIYPNNPQTMRAFHEMAQAPYEDKPIVEMNEMLKI